MRSKISDELERCRLKGLEETSEVMTDYIMINSGPIGVFRVKLKEFGEFLVFSSNSKGWEHVSVSKICKGRKRKLPSWEEMCMIKDLFFEPEELVVQYHPKSSEYINFNPGVLHLWKKQDVEFPNPPMELV